MEFTPLPTPARPLVIHRAPVNPNASQGLNTQTPQQRIQEVQQMIVLWRGRQIQHQSQAMGG